MIDKKFTYFKIQWTDKDGDIHTDFYIPADMPLPSTSFYFKSDNPEQMVKVFISRLIKYGLYPFTVSKQVAIGKVRE